LALPHGGHGLAGEQLLKAYMSGHKWRCLGKVLITSVSIISYMLRKSFAFALGVSLLCLLFSSLTAVSEPGKSGGTNQNDRLLSEPQPQALADQTAEVKKMIMAVTPTSLSQHIQTLQDFKTRYSYHPQSWGSCEYAYNVLEGLGLNPEYYNFTYGTSDMRNVVGTLRGVRNLTSPVYIIGGHIDSYTGAANNYQNAPGADDDASGVAATLVAAEVMSHWRFNYTIKFLAFMGEEQGLRGSAAYTKSLNDQGIAVAGMFSLDMVSWNLPTGGSRVSSRANAASMDLATFSHDVSVRYPEMNIDAVATQDSTANSDHASFWTYGWDAICVIEYNFGSNPHYHQTTDVISNMNMTYAANVTQLTIACFAEKAQVVSADVRGPSMLYPFPSPGGYGNETPWISVQARDPSGVDLTQTKLYLDGSSMLYASASVPMGYNLSCPYPSSLPDGAEVSCRLVAYDILGNVATYWWNFTVDGVSPPSPADLTVTLVRARPDKRGMVLNVGSAGSYDSYGAMNPSVIKDGTQYKMWYVCYNNAVYRIAQATSFNGVAWGKQGVVLSPGTAGSYDSANLGGCSVMYENGTYKMWYTGNNGTSNRILYATSANGIAWTKQGVAINLGPAGSYDDRHALTPSVSRIGGEYRMWYSGSDGVNYRILLATSPDGVTWTKRGPVMACGYYTEMDGLFIQKPAVVQLANDYLAWFTAYDGSRYRVFKAASSDGVNWTKHGLSMDLGTSGSYENLGLSGPCALIDGNEIKVWYTGYDGTRYRILLANMSTTGPGPKKETVLLNWGTEGAGELTRFEACIAMSWSAIMAPPGSSWVPLLDASLAHNPAGAGNVTSYFYAVRSVDRVGHRTTLQLRGAKLAVPVLAGWVPLGNQFEATNINSTLETLIWEAAMAWTSTNPLHRWRTNFTVRPDYMDDLVTLGGMEGCWAKAVVAGTYVSVGVVLDHAIPLEVGWNLVSYPSPTQRTAADVMAEIGPLCTRVEGFDASATYRLKALQPSDPMSPGCAYWVYVTASTTWAVTNY
jgi:predicted GH43/DUF377 family glycosyl hydrolase